MTSYRFNWHECNEIGRHSGRSVTEQMTPEAIEFAKFLDWWGLSVISDGRRNDQDLFEQISDATDSFKDIEVTISLGGVEIDAEAWLRHMDDRMTSWVNAHAQDLVKEKTESLFNEVHEIIDKIEGMMSEAESDIRHKLKAAGINIWEDD